jgi:large subunit ribosomal protein L35
MPKQKTHKGLKKRVKITATGKVKYRRPGGSHLMSGKNAKRRRRIGKATVMISPWSSKAKIELGE